ncbi:hypothetical protein BH11BAC1_BH11BAC1_29770 [soil metagenome]
MSAACLRYHGILYGVQYMKPWSAKFSREELYLQIHEEEVVSRQRFVLFRIFSYTGAFVCLGIFLKMRITISDSGLLPFLILALGFVMMLNYFAVRKVINLKLAYFIMLVSACLLLHTVAYSCGGIRTGGSLFWGVIVLYAYMLLGKKAGQYFTAVVVLHLVYMFTISTFTDLTSFSLFKNDIDLINQDFLTNGILSIFLIASQSSYLQSGKNVVIQRITKAKDELVLKNLQLEQQNKLLNDYTHQLEKTNNELDKFVSVASHDLKSPLRAIGNLAYMIEEDAGDRLPEEAKKNLTAIVSRVSRMDHLLNALLEYSRLDSTKGEETTVDLKEVVDSLPFFTMINENVHLDVKGSLPVLKNDKIKLSRVFANLVDNAIKFSDKDHVSIEISCEEKPEQFIFSVKDNGPGIDKKYHDKVFVLFQTLNRRDEMENMGVGLAITKKIVEERGGKIWIEPKQGEGTDFRFTIPKTSNQGRHFAISA